MKCIFRFNPHPPGTLPLTVRSVGEDNLPAGEFRAPAHKSFTTIFWTESGIGEFRFARRWTPARGIFFLFPGELQEKRAVTRWKFHWMTLDHPDSQRWVETMGLRHCPEQGQPCPVKLFRALQKEVRSGTADADRRASHLAHAILLEAGNFRPPTTEHYSTLIDKCRARIDAEFTVPQLNIEAIAHEMGLHRSTLFRAFMTTQGMTPSHYLQSRRMHYAMQLLKQTDLSVREVSIKSGYTDANYFARALRKMCGLSPQEFRNAYHRGEPMDANYRIHTLPALDRRTDQ